jgi:hypothetical protein
MSVASYTDVFESARQLSLEEQVELAEALLHNLRSILQGESDEVTKEKLIPLAGMSVTELQALTQAVVAPEREEQLQKLLARNRSGELSVDEQVMLDTFLAEADQVALLKARALYTLKLSGQVPGIVK